MATMSPHTVTLSPEQAARVQTYVDEGLYPSPDIAVEQLLARAFDDDLVSPYSPEVLAHLHQGMAEADRGEFVPPEDVKAFFDDWRRNG